MREVRKLESMLVLFACFIPNTTWSPQIVLGVTPEQYTGTVS